MLEEAYVLVHRCGFTYSDVLLLTSIERNKYIELRVQESERESAEMEKMSSK